VRQDSHYVTIAGLHIGDTLYVMYSRFSPVSNAAAVLNIKREYNYIGTRYIPVLQLLLIIQALAHLCFPTVDIWQSPNVFKL